MIFNPFAVCDASTTEGDEYALEVTHVQCRTKNMSMPSALKSTAKRVSVPKMPLCFCCTICTPRASERSSATVALDPALLDVAFSFFAFLGVVEGVASVTEVVEAAV